MRWADKRTQNNNKSDTLLFHYSRTGDSYTVSRLAKLQNVRPTTIRKRFERGWADDEIIEGKRTAQPSPSPRIIPARGSLPHDSPVDRRMSAKEKAFREMADYYRAHREEYGEEAIMAPYEDLVKMLPGYRISPAGYERHFKKYWPENRPHVYFERLPKSQQELIAKIDPDYVASLAAKTAMKNALKKEL